MNETPQHLITRLARSFEESGHLITGGAKISTDLSRAEGVRYLTRMLALGSLNLVENADPAYPHLTKFESPWMQFGYNNPDFVYWTAPLSGDHTYRLTGTRGTSQVFVIEVYQPDFLTHVATSQVIDSKMHILDGRGELTIGPNREIDILLSATPDGSPNHIQLPEGECRLMLRSIYGDWAAEEPDLFEIDRIGATYPPPALGADQLYERISRLCDFVAGTPPVIDAVVDSIYKQDAGVIQFPPIMEQQGRDFEHQLGLRGQYYAHGHWECESDEALILEVEPPECLYWTMFLMSQYWEALDWHIRQNSLNGQQARLDSDGWFRAVICGVDPGVPNWLDTGGHRAGLLGGRYLQAVSAPIPRLRTVPLASVGKALPADTPAVTPEERHAVIERRRHSVRRRMAD